MQLATPTSSFLDSCALVTQRSTPPSPDFAFLVLGCMLVPVQAPSCSLHRWLWMLLSLSAGVGFGPSGWRKCSRAPAAVENLLQSGARRRGLLVILLAFSWLLFGRFGAVFRRRCRSGRACFRMAHHRHLKCRGMSRFCVAHLYM